MTGSDLRVVGLLGGSFDPVHVGHVALARAAQAALPLDELRFVPAAQPWQKGQLGADAAHRAHMVELAIAGEPRWVLDMHEIERGGTTYTVDTLRCLRGGSLPDASLVLLMGWDQFAHFDTWRDWPSIVDLAHLAIAQRAGTVERLSPALAALFGERRSSASQLKEHPAGKIVQFSMPPIEASATEIRRLLHEQPQGSRDRLATLLAPRVLDYIRLHRLYA